MSGKKSAGLSGIKYILIFGLSCMTGNTFASVSIQHWQAPSGAQVYFVENHDLPMLDVEVDFAAGNGFDDIVKPGVAALTNSLLDSGVDGLSEDDISRKLADIGAQKAEHVDADRSGMSIRTLSSTAELEVALDIMSRILQHPLFPEDVLTREKTRTIAALKEAETKPESIASKAFNKAVFGSHPYGKSLEVADVEKIQKTDLENFYHAHYNSKGAVVALMGDVTRAKAESIAQQLTGSLQTNEANIHIAPVTLEIKATELRIPHPATQAHVLIGTPGIARNDPDYFPLYVGNYVLGGGGFVSRLMNEIREKRGLAYSVYSYFMPMQQPGAFQIGLQTKKEQADEAIKLARATLREFVDKGISEKELKAAKDNIVGGFPLRIDSNKKILDYLSLIGFYGLPLNYLDEFTDKVNAVTTSQVHDAFKRRIHPDAMATVIVGAPEEKMQAK